MGAEEGCLLMKNWGKGVACLLLSLFAQSFIFH